MGVEGHGDPRTLAALSREQSLNLKSWGDREAFGRRRCRCLKDISPGGIAQSCDDRDLCPGSIIKGGLHPCFLRHFTASPGAARREGALKTLLGFDSKFCDQASYATLVVGANGEDVESTLHLGAYRDFHGALPVSTLPNLLAVEIGSAGIVGGHFKDGGLNR